MEIEGKTIQKKKIFLEAVNKDSVVVLNKLELSEARQMKLRDKYLKVRIRYDGTQYAIISAIKTQFTLSYA